MQRRQVPAHRPRPLPPERPRPLPPERPRLLPPERPRLLPPEPLRHIPTHLRQLMVEQDYSRYNAIDQAVWRFVISQIHAHMGSTAHPAYLEGLAKTGISRDHIPRIEEMNEHLSRFGWSAACVDGFIPPRAFQELQASAILPIAGDIRRRQHIAYTPAPDIIHEAAGHAPLLTNAGFAAYLRRIGDLGRRAFTVPEERRSYQAIAHLSRVKEKPGTTKAELERAEAALVAALSVASEPSEATRLARLYWWTAEYGLVGQMHDYRIYGAGLLSSLWEGQACQDPRVRKLPLDESATEVSFDITREQPQLFVTPSYEALHDVLDRVARTLAAEIGGNVSLERALRSREVATVRFSSGVSVTGVLAHFGPDRLVFEDVVAFGQDGAVVAGVPWRRHTMMRGRLAGGRALELQTSDDLRSWRDRSSGQHKFRFATGATVEGRIERTVRRGDGLLWHLELSDARLEFPAKSAEELPRYVLLCAGEAVGAQAGAANPSYYDLAAGFDGDVQQSSAPDTTPPVASPRVVPATQGREQQAEHDLAQLYERAQRSETDDLAAILDALVGHPDEWLLRFLLLERLARSDPTGRRTEELWRELNGISLEPRERRILALALEAGRPSIPGKASY